MQVESAATLSFVTTNVIQKRIFLISCLSSYSVFQAKLLERVVGLRGECSEITEGKRIEQDETMRHEGEREAHFER